MQEGLLLASRKLGKPLISSQFITAAHINIVDLVQAKSRGQYPQHHQSRGALAVYTAYYNKVFPKHLAQENGFLKALLVQVF